MGNSFTTYKSNLINLGMLREKTFFRELKTPRAVQGKYLIDSARLKRKANILARRKMTQRLTFAFILSLIYLSMSVAMAILS